MIICELRLIRFSETRSARVSFDFFTPQTDRPTPLTKPRQPRRQIAVSLRFCFSFWFGFSEDCCPREQYYSSVIGSRICTGSQSQALHRLCRCHGARLVSATLARRPCASEPLSSSHEQRESSGLTRKVKEPSTINHQSDTE